LDSLSRPYDGSNGNFSIYVYFLYGINGKTTKEQNQIFKDYEESKVALYNELNEAFKNDFAKNGI
jgi:hypothetical protein